jgi:hypothetical protein
MLFELPVVLTEAFCGFPQMLQVNFRLVTCFTYSLFMIIAQSTQVTFTVAISWLNNIKVCKLETKTCSESKITLCVKQRASPLHITECYNSSYLFRGITQEDKVWEELETAFKYFMLYGKGSKKYKLMKWKSNLVMPACFCSCYMSPCHHAMACPRVTDVCDGVQIRRVGCEYIE